MQLIPYVITYSAFLVFYAVIIYKCIRLVRMPLHLRWEIYPVPHEGEKKAKYGGSFFEEVMWWKKPIKKSLTVLISLNKFLKNLSCESFIFVCIIYYILYLFFNSLISSIVKPVINDIVFISKFVSISCVVFSFIFR